ncbi:hypothetical protein H8356DRAFT_1079827 [Neocallimastix lanati (nom. inval.)]|jgi:FtsZ-binding cell division protein ZapB|uniref:NUDE domain-containing protein n=1 Tax=Neocallimastix californiae TaxID=1754190 RepID=A0A1Y2CGG9_9FUNG|nr:hypothetical protein H8356DRAFT_1079827 [Neocallimastix sp. JGI-2020a]ORY45415.1 hypothetical protein LY90DRAFT_509501 [Neocallimastix californiae]|eukprot:ORY45415.1 hypothetical protein LY90DRAFT_509501 [Neocallimastix californiae]
MEDINALREELEMWKSRAEEYKSDLEEYQQQSLEYENEMEQEINDLKQRNNDYADELSELKKKYRELHVQSNESCSNYQNELDHLKKINEQKRARERELEIVNDDLERKIRITSSTCQDLQVKYNQLLEKNVYLQQEVENKMELIVTIQRIKDELKDANIELAVLRSKLNDTNVNTNNNNVAEAMVPYQILSPNKSQTPTTTYSTVYNYDYNHQENGNNINVSGMTTPTMNDSTNEQNKIYSSDILKKNNTNNLSNELMIFTSNGTALNKKPFFMVQEFLERAKSLEMKIASARSTLAHTNELSS